MHIYVFIYIYSKPPHGSRNQIVTCMQAFMLAEWQAGRQACRQACGHAGKQAGSMHACMHAGRQVRNGRRRAT